MNKRPQTQHEFLGLGDKRNYFSDLVRYYDREGALASQESTAALCTFHELLEQCGKDDGSIMLQDHWSQYYEAVGEAQLAIIHREREIELIEKLFLIEGPVASMNRAFLGQVMHILLHHYLRCGQRDRADDLRRRIAANERQ
jgi:hypothetical protein